MAELRSMVASDLSKVLELNAGEVLSTSPMDCDQLSFLVEESICSTVATVANEVVGFVICLDSSANYENENHRWFKARFPRFLYVDRIVVSRGFAGQKIGSQIYTDLFEFARQQSEPLITCEYNIDPPNLASKAFHSRFGFQEVGTQWVANGTKLVSLQAAQT